MGRWHGGHGLFAHPQKEAMQLARRTSVLLSLGVLCFLLYAPLGKHHRLILVQQIVNNLALLLWSVSQSGREGGGRAGENGQGPCCGAVVSERERGGR